MRYLIIITGAALFLLTGCGGNKKANDPIPVPKPPVAAGLVFPAENSTCISGDVISATQSSVVLKWKAAQNADSYDIVVKNLLTTETQTQSSNTAQATIKLARNTPFSWYVISKSSQVNTTAHSDTWKFYNAGEGVKSYAPFPADNLSPALGAYIAAPSNGKIKLSWHGSDTDNDITDYDIYFGTSASPALLKLSVSGTSLDNVSVTAKTKYYWKVVTHDSNKNTSTSDIVQFNTN